MKKLALKEFFFMLLGTSLVFFALFSKKSLFLNLFFTDKQIHFLGFCQFSFFLTLFCKKILRNKTALISVFSISFFLGFSLEFIQLFMPHRVFEFADMGANWLGGLVGILFGFLTSRIFYEK